ncbi:hypothetical protein LAUMK13_04957 [Mycobacterium innocens]|uniref:Uncharacterized protein n=1 Tax=Mycobacterium innocens TaxID=2341083 RepID=A0A498QFK3_9MYCO|nr:hypothetical protein LAUMK13_04957 [Mycobacterium innocens]
MPESNSAPRDPSDVLGPALARRPKIASTPNVSNTVPMTISVVPGDLPRFGDDGWGGRRTPGCGRPRERCFNPTISKIHPTVGTTSAAIKYAA